MIIDKLPDGYTALTDEFISNCAPVGAVTAGEARVLAALVLNNKCKNCLEIGVANGASALALTQAASRISGHVYGVDPCQLNEHQSAALHLLQRHGLADNFTLLPEPAHLAAPKLLASEVKFDLAFIDGMHCFEFKSLDVFYSDRLLRVGGYLVLHDLGFQSTKKVWRLLRTTGRYRSISTHSLHLSWFWRIRRLAGAILRGKDLWYFWPNGFSNLLVLEKLHDKEVAWDHYQHF